MTMTHAQTDRQTRTDSPLLLGCDTLFSLLGFVLFTFFLAHARTVVVIIVRFHGGGKKKRTER